MPGHRHDRASAVIAKATAERDRHGAEGHGYGRDHHGETASPDELTTVIEWPTKHDHDTLTQETGRSAASGTASRIRRSRPVPSTFSSATTIKVKTAVRPVGRN